MFSPGAGRLLALEEAKERYVWNLEPTVEPGQHSKGPVRVASPSQHREAMKRAGVREPVASDWDRLKLRDRAKTKPKRWV